MVIKEAVGVLEMEVKNEEVIRLLANMQAQDGDMSCICEKYSVNQEELTRMYIKEMLVPEMTVGVVCFALRYLSTAVQNNENVGSLVQAIRDCILKARHFLCSGGSNGRVNGDD